MLHPSHEAPKRYAEDTPVFQSIIEIRLRLDCYMNSIPLLKPSREISLVFTSLQRSFMWLGEALKTTGSKSPYVKSEDPASKEIEPQAQKTKDTLAERWASIDPDHLARVKDFRAVLQETIKGFERFQDVNNFPSPRYHECMAQSWTALKEAKLWFGWELNRLKQLEDNKAASAA